MQNLNLFFNGFVFTILPIIAIGYLLGSISFANIFTRLFEKKDIRTMGSGNAGFTNVLRSANIKAALLTLIFDFAKGAISVYLGYILFSNSVFAIQFGANAKLGMFLAGLACEIGHIYPIFFNFKGGKGVLTSSAIILMIDYRIFLISISVFLFTLLISKIVSLSSILAAASLPFASFFVLFFIDYLKLNTVNLSYVFITTGVIFIIALIMILKHSSNIKRLKQGTEAKLTIKGNKKWN